MTKKQESDPQIGTVLDPKMAPRRLKKGLVPSDTGIYLRVEESPRAVSTGVVLTLSSGGVYVIGREGADIVLEGEKVSRKHAELGLFGPGAYVLRDLASTNGTLLNGRQVSDRTKIRHDDVIKIGDFMLRLFVVENSIKPA